MTSDEGAENSGFRTGLNYSLLSKYFNNSIIIYFFNARVKDIKGNLIIFVLFYDREYKKESDTERVASVSDL